uniref:Uncharacterized protein n=1 Tax=Meloidogyne enterolobii TaxID=390850 RepID=A0A6V7TMQ8_MELEN|nr:unnamed protein product [Meloidogyne enterolobii]
MFLLPNFIYLIQNVLFVALIILMMLIFCNMLYKFLPFPTNHSRLVLQGKTVLITGASSVNYTQINFLLNLIYFYGAKLILASRSIDQLEKICADLDIHNKYNANKGKLYRPTFLRLDLEEVANNEEKLEEFVKTIKLLLSNTNLNEPKLDVLINNAGQMAYGSGQRMNLNVLRRMINVNFLGHVAISQRLMDWIPDDGAIVLVSSIVGRVALPYLGAYSASKHAAQGFFDSLRAEDRPQLHILTASVGYVNTSLAINSLNEKGKTIGRTDPGQVAGMSPEYSAREIVAAVERRETDLLLAPFIPRLLLSLRLATPNLLWFLLHRRFRNIYGNFGKCCED